MTALIYKASLPTYTSAEALAANAGESLLLNETGTAYDLEPAQSGASVAPADLARGTYNHTTVGIPDDTYTALEWAADAAVDDVFDMADGTTPLVLVAGLYAVSVVCRTLAVTTKSMFVELDLDLNGEDASIDCAGDLEGGPDGYAHITIGGTYYVPEGGAIQVGVKHNVGAPADVQINAFVQQIA